MSQTSDDQERIGCVEDAINTSSRPSALRITDLRLAVVASNYDYPIIRIDTNQGVYGIGEIRDAGHKEDALRLKSFLLGQNPCNVDMIFRAIKHFGGWGRMGGGVSGIEIALWDLVGRIYGVPCYQFRRQVPRQGPHLCRHAGARRRYARSLCPADQGAQGPRLDVHQVRYPAPALRKLFRRHHRPTNPF